MPARHRLIIRDVIHKEIMIKTTQELKEQAEKIGLKRWNIHTCSMCGYSCGYIIEGDEVFYDAGCGCLYNPPQPRTWGDLTSAFNRNQPENNPDFKGEHPEAYEEHYKSWQFTH